MDFSDFKIERLNDEHDISEFDCFSKYEEDKDLNDFIKNDALEQKNEGWNSTYVAVKKRSKKVLAFFALSPDSFKIKDNIKKEKNKPRLQIPAIKIGRLAVDKTCQNKGVGKFLVKYAIGYIIKEIVPLIGGMYITLDAYPHMSEWYNKKFNFRENTLIKYKGTRYINLILPLKDFPEKINE